MQRWLVRFFLLSVTASGFSACEDESVSEVHEFQTTPYGVAACDAPNGQFMLRRELRLFANRGYDVERSATALQRYYRRFGITFYRVRPVQVLDTAFVEDGDMASLSATLRRDFPGVDLGDAGLMALSTQDPAKFATLFKELIRLEFQGALDFFAGPGGSGQGVTNVVLLKDLFTTGSPKMQREQVLGISLSPILIRELKRTGMDEAGAFAAFQPPPDFTPTVFISDTNVKWLEDRAGSVHRDLVLGHEFGHSAGLVHRMDKTNLMNPSTDGTESCNLQITDDQIAIMREGLGVTAPALARSLSADPPLDQAPLPSPTLLAAVLRGDPDAQRELLRPLLGD